MNTPSSTVQTEKPEAEARPRLRIAVLNRNFSPTGGGAERYSIALVEQLAQHHEIHVFAQHLDHHWPGVTYHPVSTPFRRPRWVNQLWYATATWWATRKGFDVVHSHENTWHGNVQTVHVLPVKYNLFHGRKGFRLLLRYLSVITSPRLLFYLLIESFRFSGEKLCSVVVTSPVLHDIMASTYPACISKLTVITPGVTMPDGNPDAIEARRRLNLPNSKLIGFVANDYQKKGLDTLLAALRQLEPSYMLAVVGSPSQIPRYRQKVKVLGLEGRVHFLGHLKDMTTFYRAVDCLAHPTTEDTFAMVVLEAMAHGLPVIVSDAKYCGIAELLSDGVNALILDSPGQVEQLTVSVRRVMECPEFRHEISAQARFFAEQYAWKTIAVVQESLYRRCLAKFLDSDVTPVEMIQ